MAGDADPRDELPPRGFVDRVTRRVWPTLDQSKIGRILKVLAVPTVRFGRFVRGWFLALADRYGILGPDQIYSEGYYRIRNTERAREQAETVASILLTEFEPRYVIDLGCATGAYLTAFREAGCIVTGVEGSSQAIEHAIIPPENMEQHDLRRPYQPDRRYDLAICFEVLEHIPERFADTVVASIVDTGEVAVVSAAPPGQGTVADHHHVNEQPPEYWIDKFADRNMVFDESRTARLKAKLEEADIDSPIKDNLMIFESTTAPETDGSSV